MAQPRTLIQPAQPAATAVTVAGRAAARIVGQAAREDSSDPHRTPQEPAAAPPFGLARDGLLLGRYRLRERLGSGGFGVVWLAYDEQLRREVAVKRIPLGPEGDADRAAREAQAAARLSHPSIVALYEAFAGGDAFYLISELVRGATLGRLIATGELSDEQTTEIGLALTDALSHAHARGVIHRDIKPQNVLVPRPADPMAPAPHAERHPAAKLTDFGGASLMGEEALTRTGDVLGTLAYMAPEQSEGREVGPQADLYALALVLYETLSGHNPVRGATTAATARRIGTALEPLHRHRPDVPAELAEAIDVALSPHPADRGTLEDLHQALREVREGTPGTRRAARTLRTRRLDRARPRPPQPVYADAERPGQEQGGTLESPLPAAAAQEQVPFVRPAIGLPRVALFALALALAGWEAAAGRPGLGLYALAALLVLLLFPGARATTRVGLCCLMCLLAPLLGTVGLAGAFPALAGQAASWRERAAMGALGYWWLVLAEPLLGRRLWLGAPAQTPPRAVWEGSIGATAAHVIAPLLTLGVLLGALLWAAGALLLALIVRGRSAPRDLLAVTVWSAALFAFAPEFGAGLSAGVHPSPRGAVLGAVLGGLSALAARALRGPV